MFFLFIFFARPKSVNTQPACGMALFFPDLETEKQRGHEMPVFAQTVRERNPDLSVLLDLVTTGFKPDFGRSLVITLPLSGGGFLRPPFLRLCHNSNSTKSGIENLNSCGGPNTRKGNCVKACLQAEIHFLPVLEFLAVGAEPQNSQK
jgi:hypothetical protein